MGVNKLDSNQRSLLNSSISIKSYFNKFTFQSISSYQNVLQAYNNIDQDLSSFDYASGSSFNKKV